MHLTPYKLLISTQCGERDPKNTEVIYPGMINIIHTLTITHAHTQKERCENSNFQTLTAYRHKSCHNLETPRHQGQQLSGVQMLCCSTECKYVCDIILNVLRMELKQSVHVLEKHFVRREETDVKRNVDALALSLSLSDCLYPTPLEDSV